MLTLTPQVIDAIIEQYGELNRLNLSNNGLQNVVAISRLSCLKVLNLSCNDLVDIAPISTLSLLEELNLSDNRIAFMEQQQQQQSTWSLGSLERLALLDLSQNLLASPAALQPLARCKALRRLCLLDNPICARANYPLCVFQVLPQV